MVDANILVALELETQGSAEARALAGRDPDWRLPVLWRFGFSNVLRNLQRAGKLAPADALGVLRGALERYAAAEIPVDEAGALALAMELGLSAYDAAYLELAVRWDVPLVTEDQELVRKGRGRALSMGQWLGARKSR